MLNLLGITREVPGLGGAGEDDEKWRQQGRTPGRDSRSEGRGVFKVLECLVGESR